MYEVNKPFNYCNSLARALGGHHQSFAGARAPRRCIDRRDARPETRSLSGVAIRRVDGGERPRGQGVGVGDDR